MKRFLLSIIALAAAFSLSAQTGEEILARIEKACANGVTIEHKFTELRSWTDHSKADVKLDGNLKWKDNNLYMDYSNCEAFSIVGNKMTIKRGGKSQVFDLTKNMMMKNLSRALTLAFQGRLLELSKEQKSNIVASRDGNDYVVILSATQKAARGYNRITVHYNARTCLIKSMKMDEFTGLSTSYSIE